MPLLNGKYVNPEEIDPTKHKFIGTFRPPTPPSPKGASCIMCHGCGHLLQTVEAEMEHWRNGHFDEPQYVDIDREVHKKLVKELTEEMEKLL